MNDSFYIFAIPGAEHDEHKNNTWEYIPRNSEKRKSKDMYKHVNLRQTIYQLLHIYSRKNFAPRMMNHNLHKGLFLNSLFK